VSSLLSNPLTAGVVQLTLSFSLTRVCSASSPLCSIYSKRAARGSRWSPDFDDSGHDKVRRWREDLAFLGRRCPRTTRISLTPCARAIRQRAQLDRRETAETGEHQVIVELQKLEAIGWRRTLDVSPWRDSLIGVSHAADRPLLVRGRNDRPIRPTRRTRISLARES